MLRIIALCALAAAVMAGCSSSKKAPASGPGTTSTKAFSTTYGQDAALLAGHIQGCAGVAAQNLGGIAQSGGGVSKATCTLDGHQVVIYTWKDAGSQQSSETLITGTLKFFASGTGWDQILGDDAASDAQQAIAAKVAASLGGKVNG